MHAYVYTYIRTFIYIWIHVSKYMNASHIFVYRHASIYVKEMTAWHGDGCMIAPKDVRRLEQELLSLSEVPTSQPSTAPVPAPMAGEIGDPIL